MARQRGLSLHLAVVLPVVLIVLASMGMVWYAAARLMSQSVRTAAGQRANASVAYTRNILEDLRHVMMADRGLKLQAEIERLDRSPDVDAVRILSSEGKVLYSSSAGEVGLMMPAHLSPPRDTGPGGADAELPQVRELPDILHADVPIFRRRRCARCHTGDKPILAFLDVDISLSRQAAGLRTWTLMAGTSLVAQFLAIVLGLVLIVHVVVVRPLRRLERRMREVQLGNYSALAEPAGTRELDSVTSGFNDMVSRLQRADELEQAARRAKMVRAEQLATMGAFATGLAHELRNPLSGIKAAVDVLAGEERGEESRRILRHVSSELARVDGVVRQLLDFAKPKSPALRRVDIRSPLNNALMLSRPRAGARQVRLDTDFPPDPIEVLADGEMVQQVVLNLVLNALDAVEGIPDARVVVSIEAHDGLAWCRVRDNGPGVAADRIPTLFRPFATTKARGTGLGLATSRRLIELQGGQLRLENPGEPGASFAFSLPLFSETLPV